MEGGVKAEKRRKEKRRKGDWDMCVKGRKTWRIREGR
jgi:hypothetical protein